MYMVCRLAGEASSNMKFVIAASIFIGKHHECRYHYRGAGYRRPSCRANLLDAARTPHESIVAVIGGSHSPMEQEFLDILLRGDQPVVLSGARGLRGMRMGQGVRQALADGRLLAISLFDDNVHRTTAGQAMQRNGLVAALSRIVLVPRVPLWQDMAYSGGGANTPADGMHARL